VLEAAGEMRKRIFESDEIGMGIARPWCVRHLNLRLRERSVVNTQLGAKISQFCK
jgi:hypothetical protein